MRSSPGVMPDLVRFGYDYVKRNEGDADKILAEVGLSLDDLTDSDQFVPFQSYAEYYEAAARELNEPNFGLKLSQEVDYDLFGPIGFDRMAGPTLRDSINIWIRFGSLYVEGAKFEMVEEGDVARLIQADARLSLQRYRQRREFADGIFLQLCRKQTGVHVVPREVRFAHSFEGDPSDHERIFGCPVYFDQPVVEIIMDRNLLDLPIKTADSELYEALLSYCEAALAERQRDHVDVVAEVERMIVELLPQGTAKAKVVASEMGMSERTLARRLADEETSFNEILDDLRQDMAVRYIAGSETPLIDTAFLLGYSNQSALTNAFRRWTGKTPRQVRAAAQK